MNMNDIPHILSCKKQMEWFQGNWSHVLILTTDVSLDPESDVYDEAKVQQLMKNIGAALKKRKSGYHKIKLEEV